MITTNIYYDFMTVMLKISKASGRQPDVSSSIGVKACEIWRLPVKSDFRMDDWMLKIRFICFERLFLHGSFILHVTVLEHFEASRQSAGFFHLVAVANIQIASFASVSKYSWFHTANHL
jgi:hypothetical protein